MSGELRGPRLPQDDRARIAQPANDRSLRSGEQVWGDCGACGGLETGDMEDVLHTDWYAAQWKFVRP
jgi:hypothetical protein